jgi:hypothetical protein
MEVCCRPADSGCGPRVRLYAPPANRASYSQAVENQGIWGRICGMEGELIDGFNPLSPVVAKSAEPQLDPGDRSKFCNPMLGTGNGVPVFATSYPAAWRVERAKEQEYYPSEYVRWGSRMFGLPNISII